jgi:hypothetical protein
MTDTNIAGHEVGVRLWNLMAATQDAEEREYFNRLSQAATKYAQVWFTDSITQRETRRNQAIWFMSWDANTAKWNVNLFMVPEGASEMTDRLLPEIELEDILWQDIDPNEIVIT